MACSRRSAWHSSVGVQARHVYNCVGKVHCVVHGDDEVLDVLLLHDDLYIEIIVEVELFEAVKLRVAFLEQPAAAWQTEGPLLRTCCTGHPHQRQAQTLLAPLLIVIAKLVGFERAFGA